MTKKHRITNSDFEDIGALFKILGDPTRLKILNLLSTSELTVSQLVESLDLTQSAISHQLATLRSLHIVKARRSGKNVYYSFDDMHIQEIYDAGIAHIKEGRSNYD